MGVLNRIPTESPTFLSLNSNLFMYSNLDIDIRLPSFVASLLRCFVASLFRCFLASSLPSFLASSLPSFLATLLRCDVAALLRSFVASWGYGSISLVLCLQLDVLKSASIHRGVAAAKAAFGTSSHSSHILRAFRFVRKGAVGVLEYTYMILLLQIYKKQNILRLSRSRLNALAPGSFPVSLHHRCTHIEHGKR